MWKMGKFVGKMGSDAWLYSAIKQLEYFITWEHNSFFSSFGFSRYSLPTCRLQLFCLNNQHVGITSYLMVCSMMEGGMMMMMREDEKTFHWALNMLNAPLVSSFSRCFNVAHVIVSDGHPVSLPSLFLLKKKNMRFTRRLSVKPVSTGSLQGRALDTTLECRLMGNQEAVGKSCSAAPLQYVRRCTHAPAEPRAARVGAYRFQINRGQHTQTDTP